MQPNFYRKRMPRREKRKDVPMTDPRREKRKNAPMTDVTHVSKLILNI